MRDINREHQEIGKMLERLIELDKPFEVSYCESLSGENRIFINEVSYDSLYDGIKNEYLSEIGYEETENVQVELSDESYMILCKEADRQGKTIDEVAIKMLSEYLN